jgi:SAM-dependent methyltransferase
MSPFKFDPARIARLDDPGRLDDLIPRVMWEALGRPDTDVIVEVGAGTGVFSEQFALLAPDAIVYAADTDQRMLDWIARVRAPLVDARRIVPVLSSETSVPVPDASADLVVMVNLHHELDDPAATYRDAARMLRPGGRVLVVDWAKRETPHGPPVAARAKPSEIEALLVAAGFADACEHAGLPHHTLITARRPVPG